MAPPEATKLLQNLRVDTSNTTPDAYRTAIEKSDNQHGQRVDSFIQGDGSNGAASGKPADYFAARSPHFASVPPATGSRNSANFDLYSGAPSLNSTGDTEASFRSRQTSISFASKATTDSGGRVTLNGPLLPKGEVVLKPRGRSIIAELHGTNKSERPRPNSPPKRSHSESELRDYDQQTGQLLNHANVERHCRAGDKRYPLLQTTVNGIAGHATVREVERAASSGAATSPGNNDSVTHSEMSSGVLLSPLSESSPVSFSSQQSPWNRRPGSLRTRSERVDLSRSGSGRRMARRTSTMSSRSPASQFLMAFSSKDAPARIPEPDEEGEEIDKTGYIIGAQVGSGGFSTIKEVFNLRDGKEVKQAVKIVRKRRKDRSEEENDKLQSEFAHEVSIWRFLKHPYILPLLLTFESPVATFCIMPMNEGGTLFDLVHDRREKRLGGLPPAFARRYSYQLASAIRYLHVDAFVVHRDIKLENVLLDMSRPDAHETGGDILLCDFGMADFINNDYRQSPEPEGDDPGHPGLGPSQNSTSITGSLNYAAPELVDARAQLYSPAVDMWAYGCVIYSLLTAQLAFSDKFAPRLVMDIRRGSWDDKPLRESEAVRDSPEDAYDLVRGCLEVDLVRRWDISDVIFSKWLEGCSELYEDRQCDWVR